MDNIILRNLAVDKNKWVKIPWHIFVTATFIFYLVSFTGLAQEENLAGKGEVPIISPTAGSLGKFVDVPVNMHTGIPSINIPIYTITEGPLKLPISLSYHAGGLKVMEKSSWVGTGWALNAGGVVSRTIRGLADEEITSAGTGGEGVSYLKDHGYFDYHLDGNGYFDWMNFAIGNKDGEPDLFFFNFGGYTGKFYFREDGKPVTIPHQDIKIEPVFCDPLTMNCSEFQELLAGWKFTIPNGTKYYFGIAKTSENMPGDDAVEHTGSLFTTNIEGCFQRNYSTWYLYKIESADSRFNIKLQYENEAYGYYTIAMGKIDGIPNDALVKNIVRGVRLSKVIFSDGTVEFIPKTTPREDLVSDICDFNAFANSEGKALHKIKISSLGFCKEFELETSYFVDTKNSLNEDVHFIDGIGDSDRKRLKLDAVTEKSCDGIVAKPPTTFTYYDEHDVPRSLLFSVDHWGFNNGAVDNEWLIPALSLDGGKTYGELRSKGIADRESHWPEMRAGALKKIKYPTGGFTEFIYGTDSIKSNVYVLPDTTWSSFGTYHCGQGGSGRCPVDESEYLFQIVASATNEVYEFVLTSTGDGYGSFKIVDSNGATFAAISVGVGDTSREIFYLPPGETFYVSGSEDTPVNGSDDYGDGIKLDVSKGLVTPGSEVLSWEEVAYYHCGMDAGGGRCPTDASQYLHQFTIGTNEAYQVKVESLTGSDGNNVEFSGSGTVWIKDIHGSIYSEIPIADGNSLTRTLNLPKGKSFYLDAEADPKGTPGFTPPYGAGIKITLNKGLVANQESRYYTVGGLRIEKIIHKKATGEDVLTTEYDYPEGVSLFGIPRYIFKLKNRLSFGLLWEEVAGVFTKAGCHILGPDRYDYLISASSIYPMQSTQGNHKGYRTVRVSSPGNGYSLYSYDMAGIPSLPLYGGVSYRDIDNTVCYGYEEDYPPPPAKHYFGRGDLTLEKHFTHQGALLKESIYDSEYKIDEFGAHGFKAVGGLQNPHPGDYFLPLYYQTRSAKKVHQEKVEKTYGPGNEASPIVKRYETKYADPYHAFPTVSTVYTAENISEKLEETIYTYAKDLDPCKKVCPECEETLQAEIQAARINYDNTVALAQAGDLATMCGTFKACVTDIRDPCNELDRYMICAWSTYEWEVNEARKRYVDCLLACTNGTDCLENAYALAGSKLKAVIALNQQNQVQKPIEVSYWKGSKLLESKYFEYAVKDEVTRNTYPEITYVVDNRVPLEGADFSRVAVDGNSLTIDDAYKTETTYRYENGQIVEIVGRDSIHVSFIYKDNLPIVKGVGITYDNLLLAYNDAVASGDYNLGLRTHAKTDEALITTYTYDPLIGMTSETDANGLTIYYEYDALGRLDYVRDHQGNIIKDLEYNYMKTSSVP